MLPVARTIDLPTNKCTNYWYFTMNNTQKYLDAFPPLATLPSYSGLDFTNRWLALQSFRTRNRGEIHKTLEGAAITNEETRIQRKTKTEKSK